MWIKKQGWLSCKSRVSILELFREKTLLILQGFSVIQIRLSRGLK